MPSISARKTPKWYPCSSCFAKEPLSRRKKDGRLFVTHLNDIEITSNSFGVHRTVAVYSSSVSASNLRSWYILPQFPREACLSRILFIRNRWNSSLSDVDTPSSADGSSGNDKLSVTPSSPINESAQNLAVFKDVPENELAQPEMFRTEAQKRLLRHVQQELEDEAGTSSDDLDHWNDDIPPPRTLPNHSRIDAATEDTNVSLGAPPSLGQPVPPTSIPPFISRELNQLRQHLQQVMTVLDNKAAASVGDSYRHSEASVPFPQNFSNDPLPPLTHPSVEMGAMLSMQEFLSLPLSAWNDSVWTKARDLFTERFHQLCAHFLESGLSNVSNTTIEAPKTDKLPTVEDMQEIMDLLQCIAQTRPHTNQLDCLMYNFFTEIRATLELYKEKKPSNKYLRNEMQVHPNFEKQNNTKMSSNTTSTGSYQPISIGILAHLVENAIYNILRNRYWHLNLTTAYQTMIQVASFATVDFSKSNYNLEQQNPGANAEYWLKQQHQASRILDSTLGVTISPPNRYDYTAVLEAWVATSKIEQQLQHRRYDPFDVSKHPSELFASRDSTETNEADTVSAEISASGVRGSFASIRAGQLIRQWQFLYASSGNDPRLKPTEAAYSYWLTCILNSGASANNANALAAARECHNVLKEIFNRAEKDNFWPSVKLYNILMHAYARAGDAESAEKVLHDLIEKAKHNAYCMPDAISFTTVINAWSRVQNQHNAPDRAERLFYLQQEFAIRTGLESLKPTVTTVSAVLQCWARSKHPHAATRVDAILQQMRELSAAGHTKLQPNVITYNTCMGVWAKSGHFDAATRVESLFHELCREYKRSNFAARLKPDFVTYVHRMDAWERSTSLTPRAIAEKIDEIFAEVAPHSTKQRHVNPHSDADSSFIRPNQQLYNTVIRAWSNCGDAVKASTYLDLMLNDYLLENNTEAMPNRHVFHFVMSAWSKRLSYEGAEAAELWLNRMHHLSRSNVTLRGISPNSMSYNTCLGAWSRITQGNSSTASSATGNVGMRESSRSTANDSLPASETDPAHGMEMKCFSVIAMERGHRLFQRMRENHIAPDEYTYGPLLRMVWAQKQATPQQKYQQARSIIDAMIRDNVPISEFVYGLAAKCGIVNVPKFRRRSNVPPPASENIAVSTNSNSNVT